MFQKRNAHPSVRVEKALAVFNRAVDELRDAALAHHDIATEAYDQSTTLAGIAAESRRAALHAEERAAKIEGLLS